jgi:hypothetical protein
MMKRFVILVLILGVAVSSAYATVDHLTAVYQAIYGPNKGRIAIVPIHFLSSSSAAEMLIPTICTPYNMDLRDKPKTTKDCNLISLYGIKISAEQKNRNKGETSIVTLDLSKFAAPDPSLFAPGKGPTEDEVVQAALQCVCMTATEKCGWKQVKILITADKKEVEKKWKKYERIYALKKKEK